MLRTILLNVRWMLCILFLFLFRLCSKVCSENVCKPIKKNKGLINVDAQDVVRRWFEARWGTSVGRFSSWVQLYPKV